MNGPTAALEPDDSEYVEVDPTGRYGRYNEVLGKGASKTVYRGFDEYEGIEVAWNQVKLYDFLQSPEDLERLYCEIHLLKTLKHSNIMKFYTSWVDTANRNINFVTEMFTSGTLRQYRQKHKRVNIRAVKHWCRQILKGLLYLHSHDPPVIHRDLKCDNIFVNGNQGEVKIGDLGLAAILRKSHAARCVGTPEFMAPEVYAEEYNELVDIYAFGMCILEMVTFEYPYSECFHPAQIYKKVVSGKKPDALYKVNDPEIRQFIEKCLATVSCRLPAKELLKDPFLQLDDYGSGSLPLEYYKDFDGIDPMLRQPLLRVHSDNNYSIDDNYLNYYGYEQGIDLDYNPPDCTSNEIHLLSSSRENEHFENVDISIKGRRGEDDGIFLRLRMADKEGRIRNIHFPFDIESDTAMDVAAEMVEELDITDQEVTKIADMINGEIISLVPEWKKGLGLEEGLDNTSCGHCQKCASSGPYRNCLSPSDDRNLPVRHCSRHGCASIHGRFEEIMYHFEESEQYVTEGAPVVSSQSDGLHYSGIWSQNCRPQLSPRGLGDEHEQLGESRLVEEKVIEMDNESNAVVGESLSKDSSLAHDLTDDYENEIRQELRWLKAKYQMQLWELRDQQRGGISRNKSFSKIVDDKKAQREDNLSSIFPSHEEKNDQFLLKSLSFSNDDQRNCAKQKIQKSAAAYGTHSGPEHMVTGKSIHSEVLLPQSLHRATSLPVDAVDLKVL